ncbi:MAG: PilN domain-containing protein [Candidatus Omnitrophica bacterium]|nr:PilN domain-containing protein [Candidatus Omnitrophota bacterium]
MAASVGLELGTSVIRAVSLEREGSGFRLLNAAQVSWSGESVDDLAGALKQLRKSLPIRSPVIIGIPTSASVVTTVHPLVVNREREALAVQFELQQHLPYDVEDAVWHYQWFSGNGQGPGGPRRDAVTTPSAPAVVAATKRSLLEERLSACQRAGIAIQAVGVSAVAAANTWFQYQGNRGTCGVLLRIDGPLLEWILMKPSGLHVFTTLRSQDASRQELLALLKSSWNSLHELFGEKPSAAPPTVVGVGAEAAAQRVWIFGGPAALNLLAQDLAPELQCPVDVLDLLRLVTPAPTAVGGGSANTPHLVVACGLALQGLGSARLTMNLLGEVIRRRRTAQARRLAWSACALCAVLALAFGALGIVTDLQRRQEMLATLAKQEQQYQALRPEARGLLKRQARVEARLRQLEAVARTRPRVIRAFGQLADVMPDEIWLTKADLIKDVELDGVVDGYARSFESLTRFMDLLKSSAGWTGVKLLGTTVTTDKTTGKELVSFTVQLQQPLGSPQQDGGGEAAVESP